MDIQVSGKNMELGEALQTHVTGRLEESVRKYFDRGAEASITFSPDRHLVGCDLTAHLSSGMFLAAHGEGNDAYGAFDSSLEKLEKRIRRYKRRLKNHHVSGKDPLPAENASYYLLEPLKEESDEESADEDANPVIIAESQTALREMTVSDAVMQLDLSEQPAIVFKNAGHGRINVVYRRRDGHIGWVDPASS
ncbi:MAG: ribosome-associated translation inhibitor RaiA [Alphaproteobacteria bacterium]|nr:ribosome-associated translation inhibitor RaiA [Alphaproteobacteria bacterium]